MNHKIQQAYKISASAFYPKINFKTKEKSLLSYLLFRFQRPLLKLLTKWQLRKYKNAPWTSPASVAIFDQLLKSTMTGLEYGSGGSTVFFAEKLGKLVSIEHHEGWHTKVKNMLEEKNISNVDYLLIKPDFTKNSNTPFHETYGLSDKDLRIKHRYSEYFDHVLNYEDQYFDFILIDGRARVECLLNAIPKLKSGGLMVLDNSERSRYHIVFQVLKNWEMIHTTNGLTDTTIWFKP